MGLFDFCMLPLYSQVNISNHISINGKKPTCSTDTLWHALSVNMVDRKQSLADCNQSMVSLILDSGIFNLLNLLDFVTSIPFSKHIFEAGIPYLVP
jgi:hypothetical protein